MSKIEVNTVDVQCGSTLTLGSSGKTVTLATGASQSGFGRTGTVDWCTTAKTSPLTAVSGKGYFINTTGGVITVTLPSSPSAGDIVALKDYASTWDDNAVTLGRAGSKIGGECNDATLSTENQSVTLIYVDGTKGWQDIHDSTANVTGLSFLTATGGNTVTTCGNFKVHTFTADGTFTVTAASAEAANNIVAYQVVAGGGGGGENDGGGGGAGGYREGKNPPVDNYTASPLAASAPTNAVTVSGSPGSYPITVGGGGGGAPAPNVNGTNGDNSVFSTITANGGGGGGSEVSCRQGTAGGSGGGGGNGGGTAGAGGAGDTPSTTPDQGFAGGNATGSGPTTRAGGGGGGASAAGINGDASGNGGNGGAGTPSEITFSGVTMAGGAGGGGRTSGGCGGAGGGADGKNTSGCADSGTANTGGGGGGAGEGANAGNGGSGKVIIRYRYQ
jgi:hypothetical protein